MTIEAQQSKPMVWLTYAWADNEDRQVDFIVQELEREDLDIHLDRRDLIPGQRLWAQIASSITDPDRCDAWAWLVSTASLTSEACREELAYALGRALSKRGKGFPVIGLVDGEFNHDDLPPALKARLCISTSEENWKARFAAGAKGVPPGRIAAEPIKPFIAKWHVPPGGQPGKAPVWLELRPRTGAWAPFVFAVPLGDQRRVGTFIIGPPNGPPQADSVVGETRGPSNRSYCWSCNSPVTPNQAAYFYLLELPTCISFGPYHSYHYEIPPDPTIDHT